MLASLNGAYRHLVLAQSDGSRQNVRVIDEPKSTLELHRPFHWGVLLIGDPETADIPNRGPEGAIVSNGALVVVPVRHAQDVEFSGRGDEEIPPFVVSVRCSPGVSQSQEMGFDGVIDLPSGLMSIGDADTEEVLTLTPGRYRLQIEVHPNDHPERVHVWYSPAV